MLVAKLGQLVAFGDCSGAFYQAPLDDEVYVEPPREAKEDRDAVWQCLRALPGIERSANGLGLALNE